MEETVYFNPGDVVTLKQDIPNKPTMLVVRKESSIIKDSEGKSTLKGMRCRWFTVCGELLEDIFNTKDLIKV